MKQSTTSKTRNKKSAPASKTQHKSGGRQSSSSAGSREGSRSTNNSDNSRSSSSDRGNSGSSSRSNGASSVSGNSGENQMRGNTSSSSRSSGRSSGRNSGRNSGREESFRGETHLEKFFLDLLKDIYYAENKIIQSLPKMQEAATTEELKDAFEDHLHQTQRHVKRLEKTFELLNQKAEGKKCEAIEGIVREVEEIIDETEDGTMTRDAALIIAAQKVEHYEIATYGGIVQLAITMQLHEVADLLDKTLVEEEDTDAKLTEIAESEINLQAEHEDSTQSSLDEGQAENQQEEEDEDDDVDEESPTML